MDAWGGLLQASGLIGGSNIDIAKSASHILNYSDPLFSQILTAKKGLQVVLELSIDSSSAIPDKSLVELLMAACDGDLVTLESALRSNSDLINKLYPTDLAGLTPLIYAIAFDQEAIVESLLDNHNADPDQHDTLIKNYTPLMWAIYFNQIDIVKILLDHQADPYLAPNEDEPKKNAISMVLPENQEIYEFFKSHNLLGRASSPIDNDDSFYSNSITNSTEDDEMNHLSNQIKLQSISAKSGLLPEDDSDNEDNYYDEEQILSTDHILRQTPNFEYDKLLPEQYIKFTDSDIPALLDYIFNLRTNIIHSQHDTKIPASIIFQLLRYSHIKVNSDELTTFLFDCFVTRLRSVTNTKSGVFNMAMNTASDTVSSGDTSTAQAAAGGAGDIVLLSYWLSVIQFLHFYFCKNDIYIKYPQFLQELINLVQSLIATLSFSINSRLNLLIDDCLLNFTSLVDVSNVLYAKDWNLFKSKKSHPNTYDDIFNMLYPPSQVELMKPSPLRYIQVLGALDYVLKLHQVDTLFRLQTFSQVFYYINAMIFNRLIANSKYCSRVKAIQIRLNVSTLEDWLRSHNYKIFKPDYIGGLDRLTGEQTFHLKNLLDITNDLKNPHSLSFYYNSLYHVGKSQLTPTIELLQWLQCMSALNDEESLINTINSFELLNYYQLFKIMNKLYKYEVDEDKLPKALVNLVKRLMNEQGEKQIQNQHKNLHYMTQSNFLLKEVYIYLNPNFVFGVALPNLTELINNYGSGLGGLRVMRAKKYQPSLPVNIMDDIDDIKQKNRENNVNDTYDYEEEEDNEEVEKIEANDDDTPEKLDGFKGDELFKTVQLPSSLAHKEWDNEFEVNPW